MPLTNSNEARRSYHSPLREQQAADTHDRILDGLVSAMADGLAEVSMPAVAREAGVSVATVYRHFPSKQALFDAMPGYFARRTGTEPLSVPRSMAELEPMMQRAFEGSERMDPVLRAAIDSPLGDEARRAQMPQRLEFIQASIEALAPSVAEPARTRLVRLILVLTSSGAMRTWSAAGLNAREAADDAFWAIQTIIEAETAKT